MLRRPAPPSGRQSAFAKAAKAVGKNHAATSAPLVFKGLGDIGEYIDTLQDQSTYGFRWEPGSLNGGALAGDIVYWPVRLRRPTPIHAVQAYAAAGLERMGAKVILCLDDLGHVAGSDLEALTSALRRWIKRATGTEWQGQYSLFSGIMT